MEKLSRYIQSLHYRQIRYVLSSSRIDVFILATSLFFLSWLISFFMFLEKEPFFNAGFVPDTDQPLDQAYVHDILLAL